MSSQKDPVALYAGLLRSIRLPALAVEVPFSVEQEKRSLGIDELIFHLAATAGSEISKQEVESEIDQAIVEVLEGLRK
jgi:hypothetical protein